MRKTLLISLLIVTTQTIAQQIELKSQTPYYTTAKLDQTGIVAIKSSNPVTAVAVSYNGRLGKSSVLINGHSYSLIQDHHYTDSKLHSNLVVLDNPTSSLQLDLDKNMRNVVVKLIHCPPLSGNLGRTKAQDNTCDEPQSVDQSIWRDGLPDPNYNRAFTETRNIIVHHTATSNNLTNYTEVVRNIYLFHTQDRGWSDIGYNYLIAQDGTIFKGRDPANGDQDRVRGAHFCASNSNTMGVSLLGNLSEVPPTDDAIASLVHLLNWKTLKDELDPLSSNAHPLNSNLNVIAGHRDGCATECPGNLAYPMLDNIRASVEEDNQECLNPPVDPEPEILTFSYGPNPVENRLRIQWPDSLNLQSITLVDLQGKSTKIKTPNENEFEINMQHFAPGVYLLAIQDEKEIYWRRIWKE